MGGDEVRIWETKCALARGCGQEMARLPPHSHNLSIYDKVPKLEESNVVGHKMAIMGETIRPTRKMAKATRKLGNGTSYRLLSLPSQQSTT